MPLLGTAWRIYPGHRAGWDSPLARFAGAIAGIALIVLGASWARPVAAATEDSPQQLEQRVKAAFLFKFAGYVEWPPGAFSAPGSPLLIGVAGNEALAQELSRVVAKRSLNGRPVNVLRVHEGEPLSGFHILFIDNSQARRLRELLPQRRPVFTITDAQNGLEQGSVINFVVVDNRVRFEISLDAARRSGLRIGAPLLSVAMRVQE
jgi:hypothetical protein